MYLCTQQTQNITVQIAKAHVSASTANRKTNAKIVKERTSASIIGLVHYVIPVKDQAFVITTEIDKIVNSAKELLYVRMAKLAVSVSNVTAHSCVLT